MQESNVIFSSSHLLLVLCWNPSLVIASDGGDHLLCLSFSVSLPLSSLTWETFAAHCVIDGNEFVMISKKKNEGRDGS